MTQAELGRLNLKTKNLIAKGGGDEVKYYKFDQEFTQYDTLYDEVADSEKVYYDPVTFEAIVSYQMDEEMLSAIGPCDQEIDIIITVSHMELIEKEIYTDINRINVVDDILEYDGKKYKIFKHVIGVWVNTTPLLINLLGEKIQ